eukprot:scaffold16011_cov126-Isochrysis_galbana.AAC.6
MYVGGRGGARGNVNGPRLLHDYNAARPFESVPLSESALSGGTAPVWPWRGARCLAFGAGAGRVESVWLPGFCVVGR